MNKKILAASFISAVMVLAPLTVAEPDAEPFDSVDGFTAKISLMRPYNVSASPAQPTSSHYQSANAGAAALYVDTLVTDQILVSVEGYADLTNQDDGKYCGEGDGGDDAYRCSGYYQITEGRFDPNPTCRLIVTYIDEIQPQDEDQDDGYLDGPVASNPLDPSQEVGSPAQAPHVEYAQYAYPCSSAPVQPGGDRYIDSATFATCTPLANGTCPGTYNVARFVPGNDKYIFSIQFGVSENNFDGGFPADPNQPEYRRHLLEDVLQQGSDEFYGNVLRLDFCTSVLVQSTPGTAAAIGAAYTAAVTGEPVEQCSPFYEPKNQLLEDQGGAHPAGHHYPGGMRVADYMDGTGLFTPIVFGEEVPPCWVDWYAYHFANVDAFGSGCGTPGSGGGY